MTVKIQLFYLLLERNRGHKTIYLLSPLKSRVWSLRPAFLGEPFSTGLLWRRAHLEQSQNKTEHDGISLPPPAIHSYILPFPSFSIPSGSTVKLHCGKSWNNGCESFKRTNPFFPPFLFFANLFIVALFYGQNE